MKYYSNQLLFHKSRRAGRRWLGIFKVARDYKTSQSSIQLLENEVMIFVHDISISISTLTSHAFINCDAFPIKFCRRNLVMKLHRPEPIICYPIFPTSPRAPFSWLPLWCLPYWKFMSISHRMRSLVSHYEEDKYAYNGQGENCRTDSNSCFGTGG